MTSLAGTKTKWFRARTWVSYVRMGGVSTSGIGRRGVLKVSKQTFAERLADEYGLEFGRVG